MEHVTVGLGVAWWFSSASAAGRASIILQLEPTSSGGGGTSPRQDLVVNKCVLTDVFSRGGYFRGKGLKVVSSLVPPLPFFYYMTRPLR